MINKYAKIAFAAALGLFLNPAKAQTTFNYTGAMQTYVVPPGVTMINIEAWGAEASILTEDYSPGAGGLGGYATGDLTVTPGETLNIFVGGQGTDGAGGFNGGGTGGFGTPSTGGGGFAGSGGGASDVRQGGATLAERVIVAGGGGGAGRDYVNGSCVPCGTGGDGGDGGALTGLDGDDPWYATFPYTNPGAGGEGGTPTAGGLGGNGTEGIDGNPGVLGIGGDGIPGSQSVASGGGGGGYYGGGAGAGANGGSGAAGGGGAGGSSYLGSLTSASTTPGVQTGNGVIIITELCTGLITTVSDDTICDGDQVILYAESTLGGTTSWDGGVVDSVAFTPPVGSTTYTATSTEPGDCGFSITIFVGEFPTVEAGPDQDVCEGDSTMVNASGTATDWSWDGGVLDGVNFLPPPATATTYTLTGTVDSTGCMATDTVIVNVVVVDIGITATGTELVANQAGGTYQWLDCPGLTDIVGETSQNFTPGADGDYAVAVTYLGCTDTSACYGVHVGMDENSPLDFGLYPNPSTDNVTIQFDGEYVYEISNAAGELIFTGRHVGNKVIDVSEVASGAYIVRIISDDRVGSMQLIKQ